MPSVHSLNGHAAFRLLVVVAGLCHLHALMGEDEGYSTARLRAVSRSFRWASDEATTAVCLRDLPLGGGEPEAALGRMMGRLRNLERLTVGRDWEAGLGFMPPDVMAKLTHVEYSGNMSLLTVEPLASCTALQELQLSSCVLLTSMAPLASCTALQKLDLASCTALRELNLFDCNRLTTVDPLVSE